MVCGDVETILSFSQRLSYTSRMKSTFARDWDNSVLLNLLAIIVWRDI